jgi:hypothetical protein
MDVERTAGWSGTGLLSPPHVDRNHRHPPWTASIKVMHGPLNPGNTAQYRGGLPIVPVPQWQRECVESASSGRSSRPRHTRLKARDAAGVAAALSMRWEGIETPTGRQFSGHSLVRPKRVPRAHETGGSTPPALTKFGIYI